jgi:hypothetical protein
MEVQNKKMIRTYRELNRLTTFMDRYRYLKLKGIIGETTFGFDRYLNQMLYTSKRWKETRDEIIIRDNGCDLGIEGYEIHGKILIHHMNPITIEDVEYDRDIIYDPEFLISTMVSTHNAIHYGDESLLPKLPIDRKPNDTCPWR